MEGDARLVESVRLMMWVSVLMALAILGMGGAPIAEMLEIGWLTTALTWIAYASVGLLAVAAFFLGGMGLWHGILVILGRDVGTVSRKRAPRAPELPARPRVEGPAS